MAHRDITDPDTFGKHVGIMYQLREVEDDEEQCDPKYLCAHMNPSYRGVKPRMEHALLIMHACDFAIREALANGTWLWVRLNEARVDTDQADDPSTNAHAQ